MNVVSRQKDIVASGAALPPEFPLVLVVSPDSVLAGQPPERCVQHPGATLSGDPRPPGLEQPPGVVSGVSVPREQPGENPQKPKAVSAAMATNCLV